MAVQWLKNLLSFKRSTPSSPIPPGLYHAMQEAEGKYTRFHLRVERDGTGMLIANAAAVAHLSPSGVVIAKGLLDGKNTDAILGDLTANFRGASADVMRADIARVEAMIKQITAPGDLYPVFNLNDAAISPHATQLIAPLQASLPLAEPEKLLPLLDRLWAVGIPHVTLLAPQKPDTTHLIRAIEHAEDLGMIAGVRGRASDLGNVELLTALVQAGMDHLTLLYASDNPAVHDALCGDGDHAAAVALLAWLEENQVCAIAEVPLIRATFSTLTATIDTLLASGADNIAFVAYATTDAALAEQDGVFSADAMRQVAATVEDTADNAQARFIWDPPVQRHPTVPLVGQIQRGPRCSGDMAVRVEADGSVIPPRGPYQSAGNILTAAWDDIWNHGVFRAYRERVESPTHCDICPGLVICAADCPGEPSGWAQG
ncbi:MAG TPA: SPASM domain-containing protein [Anaerolineae bacterium]|nr:SPASM domain-containing protein [Anaerolineae bacterium]HQH39717.1 SPASM domain-containing protein [Anaerolineae bacterium]